MLRNHFTQPIAEVSSEIQVPILVELLVRSGVYLSFRSLLVRDTPFINQATGVP
jgi:hypothetical protein